MPLATPELYVYPTSAALSAALADAVIASARAFVPSAAEPHFVVALSGGSLPSILGAGLAARKGEIDWSRWCVVLADERCVPATHPDNNLRACREALLDAVPIPASQLVAIDDALVDDAEAAAKDYAARLPRTIHLALLGMGPDGHTCSLFPGHALVQRDDPESTPRVLAIHDSPKPPAARITLSLPEVRRVADVVYVTTGAAKQPVLRAVIEDGPKSGFPAALAVPDVAGGRLRWFVDEAAAGEIGEATRAKLAGKL
ncbi:suppressor of los1-1 [Blastocladiella emersonii ATCC 22665]|nr:suppressor of los1-1 [Blastocladiella emersonii ATCC 22665]